MFAGAFCYLRLDAEADVGESTFSFHGY